MRRVKKVTERNCAQEIGESVLPTLVDFHADWCEPCKQVKPLIKKLAQMYRGRLKVCQVEVDSEPDLCAQYGIQSIPTIILLRDGAVVSSFVGVTPLRVLRVAVEALLGVR